MNIKNLLLLRDRFGARLAVGLVGRWVRGAGGGAGIEAGAGGGISIGVASGETGGIADVTVGAAVCGCN